MSTFIELGVGFNPDLAAYDNVALNGIMLGLSPREARARYERVIEFAELEEFQDLKLKNYSSGMHVRLAFSVAIQVDADILLIDEVLAVGDAAFQQKCFDVFNRMRDEGRTIVFVTHDMGAVTRFCHRAMLLERGEMVSDRRPARRRRPLPRDRLRPRGRLRGPRGRQRRAWATAPRASARCGSATTAPNDAPSRRSPSRSRSRCSSRSTRRCIDPAVSMTLLNEHRQPVVVATTTEEHEETGGFKPGERAVFAFSFHNMLAPGRYHPILTITHRGDGLDVIDRFAGGLSFVVTGLAASGGMVEIPVQTEVDALGVRPAERRRSRRGESR